MKELELKQIYPASQYLLHWNEGPITFKLFEEGTEIEVKVCMFVPLLSKFVYLLDVFLVVCMCEYAYE